jgi:hypothetical protein
MNIRRMAQGDRKHHKRSKRLNKVGQFIPENFLFSSMILMSV